jgi:hypothetical protein
MQEMRTNMEIHRKQLLTKESQLSQHGAVNTTFYDDDGCTSGYNSITDHHKYRGYVYTEEDDKLCYTTTKKYDQDNVTVPSTTTHMHINSNTDKTYPTLIHNTIDYNVSVQVQ